MDLYIYLYNPQKEDFVRLDTVRGEYPTMNLTLSHKNFSSADLERRANSSLQQSWNSLYICASCFPAMACGYIERFLRTGFYRFAFDQYALYRSVISMTDEEFRERFANLSQREISFDLNGDGIVLFPKGKLRDEGESTALARDFERQREIF